VRRGARLIATNTDATFPTSRGPAPGAGALVAALETASGVEAEVAGKPNPAMRSAVSRLLVPGPVWIVGDRPETDLALGAEAGWGRILVLSGVTGDSGTVPPQWRPDIVIPSVAELPAALERF
jgi:ribonucleotide monophosphatase NagD (HAD superfamily)